MAEADALPDSSYWRTPKAAPNYQVGMAGQVRRKNRWLGTYPGRRRKVYRNADGIKFVELPVANGGPWVHFGVADLMDDAWGGPIATPLGSYYKEDSANA